MRLCSGCHGTLPASEIAPQQSIAGASQERRHSAVPVCHRDVAVFAHAHFVRRVGDKDVSLGIQQLPKINDLPEIYARQRAHQGERQR